MAENELGTPSEDLPDHFTELSKFYEILARAESEKIPDISRETLIHLLEILEPDPMLFRLFLVLDNLDEIYPILKAISQDEWQPAVKRICSTKRFCKVLLKNRDKFSDIKDLDKKVHNEGFSSINNSFIGIIGPSPLWSTLGHEPALQEVLSQYHQLLAQVLLSALVLSHHPAKKHINKLKEEALSAVRSAAKDEDSTVLKFLPKTPVQPDIFLAAIKKLSPDLKFSSVAVLIETSLELTLGHSDESQEDFELDKWPIEDELLDDEKLQDEDLLGPLPEGYTIIKGKSRQLTAYAEWTGSQITKALAKSNQLFPFDWFSLSRLDLEILIDFLDPFCNPMGQSDEAWILALLNCMFWGGLTEDRLQSILILDKGDREHIDCDAYIPKSGHLRLKSCYPILKTPIPEDAREQVFDRQMFIDLQLPFLAIKSINNYLGKRKTSYGEPLFPLPFWEINKICQQRLREFIKRKNSLMNMYRIQTYLQNQLIRTAPFGDPAAAVLTLGKLIYVGRTKAYYASFDAHDLNEHYRLTTHNVLVDSGRQRRYVRHYPSGQGLNLGTPKRPLRTAVRDLFYELLSRLKEARSNLEEEQSVHAFIKFHNLMTLYTVMVIFFSSGKRPHHSFYIPLSTYDPVTGFCIVKDKDTADHYHTRLIWLTDACRQHLKNYHIYLNNLFSEENRKTSVNYKRKEDEILPELFFLNEDLVAEKVNQSNLKKRLKSLGYFPEVNAQRHFLKSNLQESYCAPDAVELFMGHWEAGEEGFIRSSALFPYDYRWELKNHLKKLLDSVGIRTFVFPKNLPVSLLLDDYSFPKDNETKQTQKLRLEWTPDRKPGQIWFEILGTKFQEYANPDDNRAAFKEVFSDSQKWVLRQLHRKFPQLYDCQNVDEIDERAILKFYENLAGKGVDKKAAFKRQLFFYHGLKLGTLEYGWDLNLPSFPKILLKEKNHLRPQVGPALYRFRHLEKWFVESLEGPLPNKLEHRIAQILLSGILFGGLLHKDWILSFCSALGERMYQYGDWLWFDLWEKDILPERKNSRFVEQRIPKRFRRWFADPTTQLLIYRWLKHAPKDRARCAELSPEKVLGDFLETSEYVIHSQKSLINALVEMGSAFAVISYPQYLVAYAKNQLPSASLPDERWIRSLTGSNPPVRKMPARQSLPKTLPPKTNLTLHQNELKRELTDLIPARTREKNESTRPIKEKIKRFITNTENISPTLFLLGEWAIYLLSNKTSPRDLHIEKGPHAYRTIINYLSIIAEPLFEAFGRTNPLDADEEEFFEIYEQIATKKRNKLKILLNRQKKSDRHKSYKELVNRLRLFHRFLEIKYQVADVPFDVFLGKPPNKSKILVSANFITHDEYVQVLKALGWSSPYKTRRQKMVICAFIIAYRTGLRRMEILGLRIIDIEAQGLLDILVRPHKGRRLKNHNAKRRSLLDKQATEEETRFVHDWVNVREKERSGSSDSYLFTATPLDSVMMEDNELFDEIRRLLKEVTNDDATVLHHTRHSYDTNLITSLAKRDDIPLSVVPEFFKTPEALKEQQEQLIQTIMANEITGRKKLYAAAVLMGHADPPTGFHSYIHCCDFLLGYYSRHKSAAPQLTSKAVSNLGQLGIKGAQKRLAKNEHPLVTKVFEFSGEFEEKLKHTLLSGKLDQAIEKADLKFVEHLSPTFDDIYLELRETYQVGKAKYRLPLDREEYETAIRWHDIFNSQYPQKRKGLIAAVRKINKSLHNAYYQFDDFNLVDSFIEILDAMGTDPSELKISYHASRWCSVKQGIRWEREWRTNFPPLNIQRGANCQLKKKIGCIRVSSDLISTKFEVLRFSLHTLVHY